MKLPKLVPQPGDFRKRVAAGFRSALGCRKLSGIGVMLHEWDRWAIHTPRLRGAR